MFDEEKTSVDDNCEKDCESTDECKEGDCTPTENPSDSHGCCCC